MLDFPCVGKEVSGLIGILSLRFPILDVADRNK